MKVQLFYLCMLAIVLLFLGACGDVEAVKKKEASATELPNQSENQLSLYENEQFNLVVYQNSSWKLNDEQEEKDKLIVSFKKDNVKAIITTIITDKNFKELKDEFLLGAGEVEVIENKEKQLSYKSKLETSIRTDVFLEKHENSTYIYTFMTPNKGYEKSKQAIDDFRENIETK